jgi:hypothetical protein
MSVGQTKGQLEAHIAAMVTSFERDMRPYMEATA